MRSVLRYYRGLGLVLLLLTACDSSNREDNYNRQQKYFFTEALQQVKSGGEQLRAAELDQAALSEALTQLDAGLKLAFQVERKFLDALDLRLGKNFQRYFVAGVENYRIGIEAGDEVQQRRGLQQLAAWAKFWNSEQAAILARLNPP